MSKTTTRHHQYLQQLASNGDVSARIQLGEEIDVAELPPIEPRYSKDVERVKEVKQMRGTTPHFESIYTVRK